MEKADQQSSIHAALHDEHERRFHLYTVATIVISLLLLAFSMASNDFVEQVVGIRAQYFQLTVGLLSVANLSVAVVVLILRPDGKATQHRMAVRHYNQATCEARRLLDSQVPPTDSDVTLLRQFYNVQLNLPPIPERAFLRLKAHHQRKVELSKILSAMPGMRLRQAWAVLRARIRRATADQNKQAGE